jgi:hypothetical protein
MAIERLLESCSLPPEEISSLCDKMARDSGAAWSWWWRSTRLLSVAHQPIELLEEVLGTAVPATERRSVPKFYEESLKLLFICCNGDSGDDKMKQSNLPRHVIDRSERRWASRIQQQAEAWKATKSRKDLTEQGIPVSRKRRTRPLKSRAIPT